MREKVLILTLCSHTCVNSKLRTAFSLKHEWVKELRDAGKVKVIHIPAAINISDFLTKVQPGYKVTLYNKMLNLIKLNPRIIKPKGL